MKLTSLLDPCFCHYYYVLRLDCLIYAWVKRIRFLLNIAYSLFDFFCNTLAEEPLTFTILLDPSLIIIIVHLFCLNHSTEHRREFFQETMRFHFMT